MLTERQLNTCEKLLENRDQLSPFLIFYGEQGCGKTLAAKTFTASILDVAVDALDQTPMQNYKYINFDQEEIKLEILPLIRDFLEHKNDKYKILVIDNADNLNISTSNSLLKLFEKYYQKTFVILIVHNIHKFPKTLRSRFFEIPFEHEITKDNELTEHTQGNQELLVWVEKKGGLNFIHNLKRLMLTQYTTAEHEDFVQKYKKDYAYVLMLMRIILYVEKKVMAFLDLNKFILRSHNTHIPMEDYIYMGFLLSRTNDPSPRHSE
ncbi:MAG: AAA family ATPase [Alphaproteobacteria bacterium]|nr:MAG: AAA family ATPase [Alphaproteobacteria bacterium]